MTVAILAARGSESNGVAEPFVRTFKRDYAHLNLLSDAGKVLGQFGGWFDDYNHSHQHSVLDILDRAYQGNETRQLALALGCEPVVPRLRNRALVSSIEGIPTDFLTLRETRHGISQIHRLPAHR